MPLDRPRVWLDFSELCAAEEAGTAPVYLFSQADIVNDSDGNDIELRDGMEVSVFEEDVDTAGNPDALLADGVVVRNFLESYPTVKWLIRLVKSKKRYESGAEYVYWMSDLTGRI